MTRFDTTTSVLQIPTTSSTGASTFEIDLDPSWASLVGIHGGYMAAVAIRAVEQVADGRTARTITTSFLRPGRPGPAEITVEPVRIGRSLSTFAVTITQDGRSLLTSRVTAVIALDGERWETPDPLTIAPRESCDPVAPPEGVRHFEQATALLDPAYTPFSHGPLARVGGYVRPLEARPIDTAWLVMILDWFPPSPFTRNDPPTGGVSIDYTVHLHRTMDTLAEDEWLTGFFRADLSSDGLALEHGAIRDPDGRVLAESFHTRWTG
jgi:acyl-CoA thioesterase